MVNDLRELLRDSVSDAPHDDLDTTQLLAAGRSRVRRRRAVQLAAATAAVGLVAAGASLVGPGLLGNRAAPIDRPDLVGPVLHLEDAVEAGRGDVEVVARHTEENLNRANGSHYYGVTDDGLVLVGDGPHGIRNELDLWFLDPETGEEQPLPSPPDSDWGQVLELSEDRIVVYSYGMVTADTTGAYVLDRETLEWSEVRWSGLPERDQRGVAIGPDGRVYLGVAMSPDEQREADLQAARDAAGGREVDDSGVTGERYALWSASLTDATDVRDEDLAVGSFAFDEDTMAWSARTNGTNDRVFVKDLDTGEVTDFDPMSGRRCNLLDFGLAGEQVVLSQYCGDLPEKQRDDRVQVVTTDGEPVVTVQSTSIDGAAVDDRWVEVQAQTLGQDSTDGTYLYDLETDRLLRVSDALSNFAIGGGPMPPGYVMWNQPVNDRRGQEEVIARLP
ncbi:hypothetical protein GCM10009623_28330 [Nocardioides aestuarii]|uniref:WD40 repeat domain-containing protein n=1 Tax=Nocardioides aestuarii TaxID=252231 RepID=A0ABW4TSH4_9ACTN